MSVGSVEVRHVSKGFNRPEEQISSFKQLFVRLGRIGRRRKQTILRDINITIREGEFVGIVGKNGSGKSTLLKILAGVYSPDEGEVKMEGTLTPFIELGVGFNPELSGRDNVYLNGALLGFTHKQMDKMYNDIVEFAELHDSMHKKLKNFSSGMQVRLAFSIAIRADSDILLLDEVLAVGDYEFQKKCFAYFDQLKKKNRTVILVSHDQAAVEQYCTRAILIKDGRVIADDTPQAIYSKYLKDATQNSAGGVELTGRSLREDVAEITDAVVVSEKGKHVKNVKSSEDLNLKVRIAVKKKINGVVVGVIIKKLGEAGIVTQLSTRVAGVESGPIGPGKELECNLKVENIFGAGEYLVTLQLAEQVEGGAYYDWKDDMLDFRITDRPYDYVPLYIIKSANFEVKDA